MIYKNYSQTLVEAFVQSRLSSFGNTDDRVNLFLVTKSKAKIRLEISSKNSTLKIFIRNLT